MRTQVKNIRSTNATVLPEYQDATVDLLADIMRPSLRDEDFDTEKLVILEEIFKYDDQPPFGAHEKCMAAYFPQHPLGNSILGTTESVSQLSVTAMRQYFRERYSPGNMKLVAAGRVDFDQLVSMAQQHCGDWEPVAASRTAPQSEIATGFKTITKPNAAQQYVVQISPGPAATHADRHAGRIVASMIGDDTGSRLFWELVDNGLAEYAGIGPYEFEDVGILMGFLCCSPDQAQDNVHRMADVIRRAEADGFTESELELAKNKICSQLVRQSERPTNRLFSVGTGWLQRGKYFTVKERLEAYQRVTLSDVHAFLENYPLSKNMSVAVGPLETLTAP